jgi:serine/threonine-protein kinase
MMVRVDEVCDQFEAVWKEGGRPRIEDYLGTATGAEHSALLRELLLVELAYRNRCGESPIPQEYHQRFPGNAELIDSGFASIWNGGAGPEQSEPTEPEPCLGARPRAGATKTDPGAAGAVPLCAGRFRIEEEIGKGGMGQVFRVYDEKLKRILAVKVLKEEFRDDTERIARFLVEAQLTGQLQHPGIPPIHELGELADGRPFFAMKLIEGHTLAKLLDWRENVAASLRLADDEGEVGNSPPRPDLPRWLGVFEHICQAVSFAHDKGVIHRDLKPSNVMVGFFGEVQVMDWGLAKSMVTHPSVASGTPCGKQQDTLAPCSHAWCASGGESCNDLTLPGQVLGTLPYMPPEQANGAWEQADERVDVFALGSILCEILTGKPAYLGTGDELQRKAEQGDLAEAFARLDGCGADVELLRLTRCCLARDIGSRPRDAGEVAETITSYLMGVQERLRAAEVEQATTQARAEEATKKAAAELHAAESERDAAQARAEKAAAQAAAERRARRLMMALAAAVLVVVGLGTAGGVYRQQQRQTAREKAKEGLDQVAVLREAYRFDDARTMLEQVRGWANQAADGELYARLLQTESDLELARDLDNVRQNAATEVDGKWAPDWVTVNYPEVLARHGLDVLNGDVDEMAEKIRTSAVRDTIIAALDDWVWRAEADHQEQQRLLHLANRADEPDPWRQAVRQARMRRDDKAAHQLVRETKKGKPTPGVVLLLAFLFTEESELPTMLLRRMQRERPGDFWINFTLGDRLVTQKKYQEGAECYLVAVAVRPNSVVAHNNLGNALAAKGQLDEAIVEYREAIRLKKVYPLAHYNLGNALAAKGQMDEAIVEYREAIRLKKTDAKAHSGVGNALADKSQLDEAMVEFLYAIWLKIDFPEAHHNLGTALAAKGQVDEAIVEYREAIRLTRKYPKARNGLGNALAAKGQLDEAIVEYREAIRLKKDYPEAHYNLGTVLYEKHQLEDAIAEYRNAIRLTKVYPEAHINLGNALMAKGQLDEAIVEYREAIRLKNDFSAHFNLGNALKAKGQLGQAIVEYREVIRLKKDYPEAHINLGAALAERGQLDDAIGYFKEAISLNRGHPGAHGGLGEALLQRGRFAQAEASLCRAIELLPPAHPLERHLVARRQLCRRGLALEKKLPDVLAGKLQPASDEEKREYAEVCLLIGRYKVSACLYREVFSRVPDLPDELELGHHFLAACAAAQAAAGNGGDADKLEERERTRLRQEALEWMQAELAARGKQATSARAAERVGVPRTLRRWQSDPALAGIRDKDGIAGLPETERQAWQKFWTEVDTLLERASRPNGAK